jgi:outer membrane protein OmpU
MKHEGKTMKKVLFATTALVATAGVASADITLSGMAEMGLQGGDGVATTQFFQDIDVTFTMSGTTDNGLTFGATVDIDETAAGTNPADDLGTVVFISGDFGTLTMGDTDGALDWALTEAWVGNAGSIADDETVHAGALGAYGDGAYDGQVLRYDYSVGDLGFALSVEMDDTGLRDDGFAIGFRYGLDLGGADVDLGLGYQTLTTAAGYLPGELDAAFIGPYGAGTEIDIIGFSAAVTLDSGLSAGLQYSEWDETATGGFTHLGLGVGYTFDAITVSANYGMYDGENPALWDVTGWGLAAAYDLGGGLSLHAGYGSSDYFNGTNEVDTWSFGLAMSF